MPLPVVLSIAGSDCSGGAGIQADLKTVSALGCYGLTVVTAIVAETPNIVLSIQGITPALVHDQLTLLLKTFPVAAIKTGMLFSSAIINVVAETLRQAEQKPPLIIDPVMVASSGDALLEPDAIEAYWKQLFPLATLITPNLDELALLSKNTTPLTSLAAMKQAGQELFLTTNASLLLKGGHLKGADATDILLLRDGSEHSFTAPFLEGRETHGTGCTYSAAIAALIAHKKSLPDAVALAKKFITHAIGQGHQWDKVAALNQVMPLVGI